MQCAPIPDGPVVQAATITGLPDELRRAQSLFERTGGLHAAALFDPEGRLIGVREDVGRHNALDKLIGSELLAGHLPLSTTVLMVSGRTSFEIIQKAATAGIPIVCAVSAPSSLAVDAARRFGLTLVGFLRGERFNTYTRADRIGLDGGCDRLARRRCERVADDVEDVAAERVGAREVDRAVDLGDDPAAVAASAGGRHRRARRRSPWRQRRRSRTPRRSDGPARAGRRGRRSSATRRERRHAGSHPRRVRPATTMRMS